MQDNIFETIVAKINLANEICKHAHPTTYDTIYQKQRIPEGYRVYAPSTVRKSQFSLDRELNRPWAKLPANYKNLVLLNFLNTFQQRYPRVNLNLVRYELLLNVDNEKGLGLQVE